MSEAPHSSVNSSVAKGAVLTFLGRMGAFIELLSVVLFAQTYGAEYYGIFLLFWSYIFLTSSFASLGMISVLQRFVPAAKSAEEAHGYLKTALIITLVISTSLSVVIFFTASLLVPYINTSSEQRQSIEAIIKLYVWALPLWCMIEIATGAVRAKYAFGAEVKLRIFYEQTLRIIIAMALYFMGQRIFGLYIAHLLSLAVTFVLSLRLLFQYYDFRLLRAASWDRHIVKHAISYGVPMMVSLGTQRLYSNLPLFFLNAFLPGLKGAEAVALYGVARKIVSVLQVIRQVFSYVLAPVASALHTGENKGDVQTIYAFATRLICSIFIPLATFIIVYRDDILSLAGPEFTAAGTVLLILVIGRAGEAFTGPANAIIDVIGRYRLPLVNSFMGLTVATVLMVIWIPQYGLTGAALSAAIGVNVTSLMAFMTLYLMFNLRPYTIQILRPLSFALISSSVFIVINHVFADSLIYLRLSVAFFALLAILFLLYHYGFGAEDRLALGKKKKQKKLKNGPTN